jgi:NAD(P)-dependent dehydrogenase (short-subunit alcohol dehydrogenase family)
VVPATAVVTGGTRGIGLAVVEGLARAGTTVVALGRDPRRAEATAARLVGEGLDVVGAACDVSRPDDVSRLAAELGDLAAPELLVCSAAVMGGARTVRTDPDEWDRVLATNLTGVFSAVRVFGAPMLARREGRIVVLSACLGRMSGPGTSGGLAPYRVSKAAVNALVKNLSAEVRGVAVDAVCPGHCRTDMGGPEAPRSAQEGADTVLWLATRGDANPTGLLWEDRTPVPW